MAPLALRLLCPKPLSAASTNKSFAVCGTYTGLRAVSDGSARTGWFGFLCSQLFSVLADRNLPYLQVCLQTW